MAEFLMFDVNYLSVLLLVIMLFITRIKKDILTFSSQLFTGIMIMNILGLLIEPLTYLIDGKAGIINVIISYASNFIFVLAAPILVGLWASYLDYKLFKSKSRIQRFHYYQLPTYIIFMLLILNIWFPIFFTITDQNVYIRGNYHILRYILTYLLFFRLIQLALTHHKKENNRVVFGILIFMVLPGVGALVQLFVPSILSTWSSLALVVVVVYIFLETTPGSKDYLTQLYARKVIEDYINAMIENHQQFTMIMIDLDRFKIINDTYGHSVGDKVLISFSELLRDQEVKDLFASRLGGDEFLLIIKEASEADAQAYIKRLRQRFMEAEAFKSFTSLDFSAGYVSYLDHMSVDDMLAIADSRMYERKKTYKQS